MPDRIKNLVMTRHLYETLLNLRDLAVDGQEAREADATCGEDRLRNAEAKATLDIADFYLEEFRERYNGGHLNDNTESLYVLDRQDYKSNPMRFAENLYEAGLTEMRRQGIEPSIHTVPERIKGSVNDLERSIRALSADFDTGPMLQAISDIREEAGLTAPDEAKAA